MKRAKPSVFFNSGSFLHKSITLQLHMTRVRITWKPTPRSGLDLNAEMQDSWVHKDSQWENSGQGSLGTNKELLLSGKSKAGLCTSRT